MPQTRSLHLRRDMKMKKAKKARSLTLHKETLRRLGSSELQGVAGMGRIRIPVGYAADTTPVYDDLDTTSDTCP
jgi:hypothetical protein